MFRGMILQASKNAAEDLDDLPQKPVNERTNERGLLNTFAARS